MTADQAKAFAVNAKATEADADSPTATALGGGKQRGRAQVRLMVRTQLQIEDVDLSNVTDEWIDGLFHLFDADKSGTIDDAEWDILVLALKEEAGKIGMQDAAVASQPAGRPAGGAAAAEPEPEPEQTGGRCSCS